MALSLGLAATVGPASLIVLADEAPSVESPPPYFDARAHKPEYVGPGREERVPSTEEIRLAYFGPAEEDHPEWGEGWRGAALAIEEANAGGGLRGAPFRLMPAWSENPWGTGVGELARLVHTEGVWAILGGVDGVSTHLAEQIVVKARVPQVSFGNTDASVHLTNVPWTLSVAPTDDAVAPALAQRVLGLAGADRRWAAISGTDHDARTTWRSMDGALAAAGAPAPVLHLEASRIDRDAERLAQAITAGDAPVVVVVAGASEAGLMVRSLRDAGYAGSIVGAASCGRVPFLHAAAGAADGVILPVLFDPASAPELVAAYRARFGVEPDWLAAHAYDATRLVVAAIRAAGLNRPRILDALRAEVVPWRGATGWIQWDATGRVTRVVPMGIIRDGKVTTLPD